MIEIYCIKLYISFNVKEYEYSKHFNKSTKKTKILTAI